METHGRWAASDGDETVGAVVGVLAGVVVDAWVGEVVEET